MSELKTLTKTEIKNINELPLVSTQVLLTLLNALYAEPGFSDVTVMDLAKTLEMDVKVVKGAIGHMTKLQLVSPVSMDVNNRKIDFMYSDLHSYDNNCDGDARKVEAIKVLEKHLAKLNKAATTPKVTPQVPALKGMTPLGVKPAKKVETVRDAMNAEQEKLAAGRIKGTQEARDLMARVRAARKSK